MTRPALEIARQMSVRDPEWMAVSIEMAARRAGVTLTIEEPKIVRYAKPDGRIG